MSFAEALLKVYVGPNATSVCLEVLLYCKPLSRLEGNHGAFNLHASRSETEGRVFPGAHYQLCYCNETLVVDVP